MGICNFHYSIRGFFYMYVTFCLFVVFDVACYPFDEGSVNYYTQWQPLVTQMKICWQKTCYGILKRCCYVILTIVLRSKVFLEKFKHLSNFTTKAVFLNLLLILVRNKTETWYNNGYNNGHQILILLCVSSCFYPT